MGGDESNRERFERLSAARVAAAAEAIRRVGNFSNRRIYDYRETDVEEIFDRLQAQLDSTRARLEDGLRRGGGR